MRLCLCVNVMEPPPDTLGARQMTFFFLSFSLLFLLVFGESVPLLIPECLHGIKEKFIPEKGKARGQRSLEQAGRQAFEQAAEPLLFGYLNHAVQQAPVAPHLSGRIGTFGT